MPPAPSVAWAARRRRSLLAPLEAQRMTPYRRSAGRSARLEVAWVAPRRRLPLATLGVSEDDALPSLRSREAERDWSLGASL